MWVAPQDGTIALRKTHTSSVLSQRTLQLCHRSSLHGGLWNVDETQVVEVTSRWFCRARKDPCKLRSVSKDACYGCYGNSASGNVGPSKHR